MLTADRMHPTAAVVFLLGAQLLLAGCAAAPAPAAGPSHRPSATPSSAAPTTALPLPPLFEVPIEPATEPTTQPTPEQVEVGFRLDFDDTNVLTSQPGGAVVVREATARGGTLEQVESHPGAGRALRFPHFASGPDGPRAGLIISAGDRPLPNPGSGELGFGADVWFPELGEQVSSPHDNGDNIIQRGLFSEPRQFKLQVDGSRPSCNVKGSLGVLEVKGAKLRPQVWYRLRCDLTHDALRITVTDLDNSSSVERETTGPVGELDFDPHVIIAVGHKVTPENQLVKRTPDQFNGTLDSVWVSVREER